MALFTFIARLPIDVFLLRGFCRYERLRDVVVDMFWRTFSWVAVPTAPAGGDPPTLKRIPSGYNILTDKNNLGIPSESIEIIRNTAHVEKR